MTYGGGSYRGTTRCGRTGWVYTHLGRIGDVFCTLVFQVLEEILTKEVTSVAFVVIHRGCYTAIPNVEVDMDEFGGEVLEARLAFLSR